MSVRIGFLLSTLLITATRFSAQSFQLGIKGGGDPSVADELTGWRYAFPEYMTT